MQAERQPTAPPETPPSPIAQPGAVGCSLQRMVRRLLARRDLWREIGRTATTDESKAMCEGAAIGVEWAAADIALEWPCECSYHNPKTPK